MIRGLSKGGKSENQSSTTPGGHRGHPSITLHGYHKEQMSRSRIDPSIERERKNGKGLGGTAVR